MLTADKNNLGHRLRSSLAIPTSLRYKHAVSSQMTAKANGISVLEGKKRARRLSLAAAPLILLNQSIIS